MGFFDIHIFHLSFLTGLLPSLFLDHSLFQCPARRKGLLLAGFLPNNLAGGYERCGERIKKSVNFQMGENELASVSCLSSIKKRDDSTISDFIPSCRSSLQLLFLQIFVLSF